MADNLQQSARIHRQRDRGALKRTVEGAFEHVRVRGEISGFKRAGSGHLYFALKDERRGARRRLLAHRRGPARRSRPRTGWRSSPPAGSPPIPAARNTSSSSRDGAGGRRRAAGAAGGAAQEAGRRRPVRCRRARSRCPFCREVIGVVTSPTGAVIRDILHRLADRFPRRVLLWPVRCRASGGEGRSPPPSPASTPCCPAAPCRGPTS